MKLSLYNHDIFLKEEIYQKKLNLELYTKIIIHQHPLKEQPNRLLVDNFLFCFSARRRFLGLAKRQSYAFKRRAAIKRMRAGYSFKMLMTHYSNFQSGVNNFQLAHILFAKQRKKSYLYNVQKRFRNLYLEKICTLLIVVVSKSGFIVYCNGMFLVISVQYFYGKYFRMFNTNRITKPNLIVSILKKSFVFYRSFHYEIKLKQKRSRMRIYLPFFKKERFQRTIRYRFLRKFRLYLVKAQFLPNQFTHFSDFNKSEQFLNVRFSQKLYNFFNLL